MDVKKPSTRVSNAFHRQPKWTAPPAATDGSSFAKSRAEMPADTTARVAAGSSVVGPRSGGGVRVGSGGGGEGGEGGEGGGGAGGGGGGGGGRVELAGSIASAIATASASTSSRQSPRGESISFFPGRGPMISRVPATAAPRRRTCTTICMGSSSFAAANGSYPRREATASRSSRSLGHPAIEGSWAYASRARAGSSACAAAAAKTTQSAANAGPASAGQPPRRADRARTRGHIRAALYVSAPSRRVDPTYLVRIRFPST